MKHKSQSSKMLNAAILEVVDNQLRDGNLPEAQQTYDRLMKAGHTDKESRELIGCVVSSEIFDMLKKRKPYDRDRYIAALKRLPTLPWE